MKWLRKATVLELEKVGTAVDTLADDVKAIKATLRTLKTQIRKLDDRIREVEDVELEPGEDEQV